MSNNELLDHLDALGERDTETAWRASSGPSLADMRSTLDRRRTRRRHRMLGATSAVAVIVGGLFIGSQVTNSTEVVVAAQQGPATAGISDAAAAEQEPAETETPETAATEPVPCADASTLVITPELDDVAVSVTVPVPKPEVSVRDWDHPLGTVVVVDTTEVELRLPEGHHHDRLALSIASAAGAPICDPLAVQVHIGTALAATFSWDQLADTNGADVPGNSPAIADLQPVIVDNNLPASLAPADAVACPIQPGRSHQHANRVAQNVGGPAATAEQALLNVLAENAELPAAGWDRFDLDDTIADGPVLFARPIKGVAITDRHPPSSTADYAVLLRSTAHHSAQAGETLTALSSAYNVEVETLRAANPGLGTDEALVAGQLVRVTGAFNDVRSADANVHGDHYEAVALISSDADGWSAAVVTWREC